MKRKGFTLVEVLIILAITAMLSTIAIVYSHVGQNQISLSIEESKIGQLILEAKELSIATYSAGDNTCAYGVSFDYPDQEYSLFAYNASTSDGFCPSLASTTAPNTIDTDAVQPYAAGSWNIHVAQGVTLVDPSSTPASDTIDYIMFYPPDPFTLIDVDGDGGMFLSSYTSPAIPSTANIYLETTDGSLSRVISVNPTGQVDL